MHEHLMIQAAFEQDSAAHRHKWAVWDQKAGKLKYAALNQQSAAFWSSQARALMGITEADQFYA